MSQIPASYVMGHDDRERRRLSLQASILNPLSDQLLRRAGLSAGLRVLDIGCGVGELSKEETISHGGCVPGPAMAGCFARKR